MRWAGSLLFAGVVLAGVGNAGVPEARAAFDAKKYSVAIQLATEGLQRPGVGAEEVRQLRTLRGRAQEASGALIEAIAELTAVIDSQRAIAPFDCSLLKAYQARLRAYLRLARTTAAEADLNQIVDCAPNDAQAQYELGTAYAWLGKDELAIVRFTAAIKVQPNYAEAYGARGPAHQNLRQYEAALADYTEAIRLDPKNAGYYGNRATVNSTLGRIDAEAADLDTSIALDPSDWASHLRRVELDIQRGNREAALADYEVGKARLKDFYRQNPYAQTNPNFQAFLQSWFDRIDAELAKTK